MKELRVLDLECCDCVTDEELAKIPGLVPRLRFLSLRGCIGIAHLPDSIGCLRQLQTLDLRRTDITTLPSSILKLRKLHCLRAGRTMRGRMEGDPYVPWSSRLRRGFLASRSSSSWQTRSGGYYDKEGVTMPRGFGSKLTALHTLGIVNVNTAAGEATLEQLRSRFGTIAQA
jgi:Leucine-rich repeat (LRR) protein